MYVPCTPHRSLSADCNSPSKNISMLCLLLNYLPEKSYAWKRENYVIDCDLPHCIYGQSSTKLSARIRYPPQDHTSTPYFSSKQQPQPQPQENHKVHLYTNHWFSRDYDNFMLAPIDAFKAYYSSSNYSRLVETLGLNLSVNRRMTVNCDSILLAWERCLIMSDQLPSENPKVIEQQFGCRLKVH